MSKRVCNKELYELGELKGKPVVEVAILVVVLINDESKLVSLWS